MREYVAMMTDQLFLPTEDLKPREREVLQLIAQGLSNQDIAERLFIAVTTVRWHNRQLYSKLGVHTRTKVVARARQLGLLDQASSPLIDEVAIQSDGSPTLPVYMMPFIGRVREMNKIQSLLGSSRLLTLTGPGGSGKTRLALQVADRLRTDYPDGVWFVPLAAIQDAGLVTNAVVSTLNAPEIRGNTPETNLIKYLQNKHLLLIIDNFEHVVPAAPLLARLLQYVSHLKVLVTSREVLHLYGEQEYPVPPLSVPSDDLSLTDYDIGKFESVTLFVKRAQAVQPDFQLSQQNAATIAEICARLDGLPLAIELAAAQVKLLTPDGILEKLRGGLDALAKGPRDAPARQRTLRATIEWSFDLLSNDEKTLLIRLSAFNGGWQLAAMESVCGSGLGIDILDGLASLIDKSLVQSLPDPYGEPRFSMLETLRQFAAEQLDPAAAHEIRKQHFDWFLDLAERAEQGLRGRDAQRWYDCLRVEEANLRAALNWCAGHETHRQQGIRLAGALWNYWHLCGKFHEGRGWLNLLLDQLNVVSNSAQARAFNGAGIMAYRQGDYAEVVRYCGEALKISKSIGDLNESALALHYLAHTEQEQGHYDVATSILAQSLELYDAQQNDWGRGQTLNCLGDLHRQLGHYPLALELLEKSLELCRAINSRRGIMVTSSNLGHVLCRLSDLDRAKRCFHESLEIAEAMDSKPDITMMLHGFAAIAVAAGHYAWGAKLLGALDVLLPKVGMVLEPPDRVDFDYNVNQARTFLDPQTFDTAWHDGQRLSLEQAMRFALQMDQRYLNS